MSQLIPMIGKQRTVRSWKQCAFCPNISTFKNPGEFSAHLREKHCIREGGSYVCNYGNNGVCSTLPVEGVSDRDYEDHVAKNHVLIGLKNKPVKLESGMECSIPEIKKSVQSDIMKCSIPPNLIDKQVQWNVNFSVQNLPAVLNDPRKVKREMDLFTKTWGDNFYDKSENIPKNYALPVVNKSHFENYIHRTSKRHKKYLRRTALLAARQDPNKQADAVSSLTNLKITNASLDKTEFDVSLIPKIFLQQNFDLTKPDTFRTVLPWYEIDNSSGSSKSKLLQEKLTHYLDVVEIHIAKQILLQSDAFFHAMSSHDELTDQLEMTVKAVTHLREKIHSIDSVLVKGSLNILLKTRTRASYLNIYKKLKLMATVHQTQATIQFLLSTSDFVGALDLIATSREVLSQELAGIQALRHLNSQLIEIERVIDKIMQTDFLKYITADLNRPATADEIKVMQEERLVAIIFGQLRLKRLTFIDVYKNEACTAIKALIKQTVIEAISNSDETNDDNIDANLADQMRMLNFDEWIKLLKATFSNIQLIIERIKATHGIMKDAINLAAGFMEGKLTSEISCNFYIPDDPEIMSVSNGDHKTLQSNLDDLLYSVCDYSHDRCAKLLTARAKDGFMDKLAISEFIIISNCIEQFTDYCSNICGRPSTSLKLALRSQASKIVVKFHEERKTKLSLILDNERWKQADVPTEFQTLADHLANSTTLSMPKKLSESDTLKNHPAEFLNVNNEKFVVVGTALLLFKMLIEYCQCVIDIPSVAPELLNFILDLLKTFNSRTCQLILGAGALQLVGLKTITTKNLALTSRCLQLILVFIPKIKEFFEKHLPDKQNSVCKNFDQIMKDYSNHIGEINKMLVGIAKTMFENQLCKWVVKAPVPSSSFKTICKQLAKVHEAVCDILPESQLFTIFKDINSSFKDRLRKQILRLNVCNNGGPQHGLVTQDLTFYSENMKSMKLTFDLGLEDIWKMS